MIDPAHTLFAAKRVQLAFRNKDHSGLAIQAMDRWTELKSRLSPVSATPDVHEVSEVISLLTDIKGLRRNHIEDSWLDDIEREARAWVVGPEEAKP